MNALPRLAILSLSIFGLAACASMHQNSRETASMAASRQQLPSDEDDAYVQWVEDNATRYGITVKWVNIPKRSQRVGRHD